MERNIKEERYDRIVENVENKVRITFRNNFELNEKVRDCAIDIFTDGNNIDTEENLINVLTDEDNAEILSMAQEIGIQMIEHIIDKDYMDKLVEEHKRFIIESLVEMVKNDTEKLYLEDIEDMEVLEQGHMSNLIAEEDFSRGNAKIKTKTWISRMTVEDGMEFDNEITVEIFINGNLEHTFSYQALGGGLND